MQRRELFRLLGAGAALPVLSPDVFALFHAAQPASGYALRTLNPHQNATVVTMIDIILPETDTPGAKAARVNEFIDLILTEWATPEERTLLLDGLASIDQRAGLLFGKDFVGCQSSQQETILRELDERAALDRERLIPRGKRGSPFRGSFFGMFKQITLYGYYTSEIGFKQELKEEIIPGAYHGCASVASRGEV